MGAGQPWSCPRKLVYWERSNSPNFRRRQGLSKKRFQPEEIIGKLRHADVLLGQGKKVAEVVKAPGVSDVTDSRWHQELGGMSTAQAKRLKELDRENRQLRMIVAARPPDEPIRPETATETCCAPPAVGPGWPQAWGPGSTS